MNFILNNFRVPFTKAEQPLELLASKELNLPAQAIKSVKILRQSVDARKKMALSFVYNLKLDIEGSKKQIERALKACPGLRPYSLPPQFSRTKGTRPLCFRPVVIGAGPAGYFAALILAENGYAPLLLERGDDVDTRSLKVSEFWQGGELDPESNVQFGEGGAGTFSDGKLTTRINDRRIAEVLQHFVESGAPEEILYKHKPHVGTDKLRFVVKGLRQKVIAAGGEVRFRAKLTGLLVEKGNLTGVIINGFEEIPTETVILAIGHSARDTYVMLEDSDVRMEPKAFALGVRVEHPQGLIDDIQYGQYAGHPLLGAADYQLAYQDADTARGAYAFCMCPGGKVVAAASEKGGVVTNGMSEFARDTGTANSALVVTVTPQDFNIPGALGGVEFQRTWERAAFKLGGSNYHAPIQSVQDFIQDKTSSNLGLKPTYQPGVAEANLRESLPKDVSEVLSRALVNFENKIQGFSGEKAVLTGVETRTSAPLRIMRDESMQSVTLKGLYPIGEGAGYAGGIISAAVDGIKAAEAVIGEYAPAQRRN